MQPDHGARQGRLATAGFADKAQSLALVQREVNAIDRAQHGLGRERSGGQAKMLVQVTKFEQGLGHAATS